MTATLTEQWTPMTRELRERFDRDGFLIIRHALSPHEVAYYTDAIDYTQVKPLEEFDAEEIGPARRVHGDVRVNRQIVGFKKIKFYTMENVGAALKARGLGWGDVFKCTVFIADMKNWPAFNAVYVPYFHPGKLPARSAVGAAGLALGAKKLNSPTG